MVKDLLFFGNVLKRDPLEWFVNFGQDVVYDSFLIAIKYEISCRLFDADI